MQSFTEQLEKGELGILSKCMNKLIFMCKAPQIQQCKVYLEYEALKTVFPNHAVMSQIITVFALPLAG